MEECSFFGSFPQGYWLKGSCGDKWRGILESFDVHLLYFFIYYDHSSPLVSLAAKNIWIFKQKNDRRLPFLEQSLSKDNVMWKFELLRQSFPCYLKNDKRKVVCLTKYDIFGNAISTERAVASWLIHFKTKKGENFDGDISQTLNVFLFSTTALFPTLSSRAIQQTGAIAANDKRTSFFLYSLEHLSNQSITSKRVSLTNSPNPQKNQLKTIKNHPKSSFPTISPSFLPTFHNTRHLL